MSTLEIQRKVRVLILKFIVNFFKLAPYKDDERSVKKILLGTKTEIIALPFNLGKVIEEK